MNAAKVVGAGAFVLGGMLLFTVALFMIGERRQLFEDRFEVFTEFAELGQLEVGATVRVSGLGAGEVTEILIPTSPSQKFRVRMELVEDVHPIVRTDSVAVTQTEGLVGAIFVNIAPGTEKAPPVAEGGTIPSREPFAIADLMEQASKAVGLVTETVELLREDTEKAVKEIASTAENAHALIVDIRPDITAIAANGRSISDGTRDIVAAINEGRGTIGKLVNDDGLYQQAKQIATEAQTVMANVREVSNEARRAISDFRSKDGPAQGLMADMRVTLGQAREATADLADNMEAMKRNFLLRGFFNRRGYFDLDEISPAGYRGGVLENGKRKAMRIWLKSGVLFEPGPDGIEVLTADGRARLDSAMATYLEYLPANPLIVEGYATEGTTGDRFRIARIRSGVVREYLLGRYELRPQNTGYIALGDEALESPADNDRWDGVALTLFLDRAELTLNGQGASP
jgi:phospholipid/cholesterol/gamma-HCH transport system substrate-binding protein